MYILWEVVQIETPSIWDMSTLGPPQVTLEGSRGQITGKPTNLKDGNGVKN